MASSHKQGGEGAEASTTSGRAATAAAAAPSATHAEQAADPAGASPPALAPEAEQQSECNQGLAGPPTKPQEEPPCPVHAHNTRNRNRPAQDLQQQPPLPLSPQPQQQAQQGEAPRQQRRTAKCGQHKVQFSQGPLEQKYGTQDGHPDHEGRLARQRRSLGLSWGHDLTPSSVRALESGPDALGEECQPSLSRLKRRVGLLPLRKRPRDYLTWMLDKESDGTDGADGSGGSSEVKSGKQGSKRAKQQGMQQEGQQEGRAASKGRPGGSAGPGGGGNNTLQVVHKLTVKGVAKKAAPKPQSETNSAAAAAPPAGPRTTTVTFQRKREPAAGADAMLNGGSSSSMNGSSNDGTATAGAVAKGSRRLGGLAGPIGSIRSAVRTLPDSLAGT